MLGCKLTSSRMTSGRWALALVAGLLQVVAGHESYQQFMENLRRSDQCGTVSVFFLFFFRGGGKFEKFCSLLKKKKKEIYIF